MKRIIINIQPFIFNQSIQIYENDTLIERKLAPLKTLSKVIQDYCKENKINQIELNGNRYFTNKIQKELIEFVKFEKMDLNIVSY